MGENIGCDCNHKIDNRVLEDVLLSGVVPVIRLLGGVSLPVLLLKKYARGYLHSLPIFYVFAERGEYIKDTFGQARHRKLARRVGRTSCTLCSSVSCSHGRCSHRNHSFLTCDSFTSFSVLILLNHDE
jgi:hypothetical protein